ncbi:hypothetical protein [Amycolatopsis sp.]|uniref:hypothetical protein n=1 Tax=Amycolatopsis sp. TaxID=37632 RepID=UPI002D8087EC|nr:hypothetical protein [Amycolatopsis sp.]HET6706454.1 hypothetical protein [Amycolatopsis sp.]
MPTEDAHRRMTETLQRAAGEPEPDSFPVQVRWDPAALGVPAAVFVVSAVVAPLCLWGAREPGPGRARRRPAPARGPRPDPFGGVLGTTVVRAPEVRLSSADPAKPSPATGRVPRLGGNAGTSLLVAGGRVIRVSDQNVTVSSSC